MLEHPTQHSLPKSAVNSLMGSWTESADARPKPITGKERNEEWIELMVKAFEGVPEMYNEI